MDFYGAMATLGFFNVTFGCMDQDLCEMHPFQIYSNSFPKSSSPSPFFEKKLAWQTAINKPEKNKNISLPKSYVVGPQVVWGRYNLTRTPTDPIHLPPRPKRHPLLPTHGCKPVPHAQRPLQAFSSSSIRNLSGSFCWSVGDIEGLKGWSQII